MKLNPLEYEFGVSSDKFLGFMVTWRGIKANLIQLKAIMDSHLPTSKKEMQQLIGWLAALRRFISRFTDRLKPFFITLRGAKKADCNEEYNHAFMAIKQYLTESPILASPEVGDTLYLYLAVSEASMSAVMFKKDENQKQRPIFFVSKSLSKVETRLLLANRAHTQGYYRADVAAYVKKCDRYQQPPSQGCRLKT